MVGLTLYLVKVVRFFRGVRGKRQLGERDMGLSTIGDKTKETDIKRKRS